MLSTYAVAGESVTVGAVGCRFVRAIVAEPVAVSLLGSITVAVHSIVSLLAASVLSRASVVPEPMVVPCVMLLQL